MDLKEMIVTVVYQTPGGLAPLEIVETLARQFDMQTNARQILQTVRANPKMFVEKGGRVVRPSDSAPTGAGSKMSLKEMIVAVVYETPQGLAPVEIVEALARQFDAQTTTRQVLQVVQANPKLFIETGGRVDRPSDSTPVRTGRIGLKEMVVTVVYESPDGLAPVDIVEALARQFDAQTTTRQVLQMVKANPKLFIESGGKVTRPSSQNGD